MTSAAKNNTGSDIREKCFRLIAGLLMLCILMCIVFYFYLGYSGYDIKGHWRISRYTLLGYDPFPLIGKGALLDSVGKIPSGFATVPWCCVMGTAFYGAFLPLEQAKIYLWVLHCIAYIVTGAVVCRKFREKFSSQLLLLFLLLIGGHFSFMYSLRYGNSGAILCCLCILAICLTDSNPWIAGICMGFAMTKPQISMIICLVWLLNRKWKPLITAAVIDIAGWAASSAITGTSPLVLLKETFSSGTVSPKQYLGLLGFLQSFGVNSTLILMENMLIGILFTVGGWIYLKKKCGAEADSLILYAPACAASTFWMYKNGTDYLILAFVAAFFIWLCLEKKISTKHFVLSAGCVFYLEMSRCAVYFLIMVGGKTAAIRNMAKSADGFLIAVAAMILCRFWCVYRTKE